jgi:hypothetical protein
MFGDSSVVRYDQHRNPRREPSEEIEDPADQFRVEVRRWLVGDYEVHVASEHPSDGHALPLTARETIDEPVAVGGQVDLAEGSTDPPRVRLPRWLRLRHRFRDWRDRRRYPWHYTHDATTREASTYRDPEPPRAR